MNVCATPLTQAQPEGVGETSRYGHIRDPSVYKISVSTNTIHQHLWKKTSHFIFNHKMLSQHCQNTDPSFQNSIYTQLSPLLSQLSTTLSNMFCLCACCFYPGVTNSQISFWNKASYWKLHIILQLSIIPPLHLTQQDMLHDSKITSLSLTYNCNLTITYFSLTDIYLKGTGFHTSAAMLIRPISFWNTPLNPI